MSNLSCPPAHPWQNLPNVQNLTTRKQPIHHRARFAASFSIAIVERMPSPRQAFLTWDSPFHCNSSSPDGSPKRCTSSARGYKSYDVYDKVICRDWQLLNCCGRLARWSAAKLFSSHPFKPPKTFFLSLSSFSMAAHICDSSAYCRRHFILFVPSRTCWATWWSRNHFNAWPNHHRVWLQWCCPARFCRRETYASHFPQRRPCAITSPSSFLEVLLHSRTPHSDALRLHRKQSIVSCAFLFLVALDGAFVLSCTGWESKHQDKKTL